MNEQQRQILTFERRFYRSAANKEADIAQEFGVGPMRYYTQLNAVLDDPEALAADPVLVKRLRRIRDSRAKMRRAG